MYESKSSFIHLSETINNKLTKIITMYQWITFQHKNYFFIYHTESVNGIATCVYLTGSMTYLASMADNLIEITSLCMPPTTSIPNKLDWRGLSEVWKRL